MKNRRKFRVCEANNFAEELELAYSTIHEILKRLIHMFQYKIAKVQHLTEDEKKNELS